MNTWWRKGKDKIENQKWRMEQKSKKGERQREREREREEGGKDAFWKTELIFDSVTLSLQLCHESGLVGGKRNNFLSPPLPLIVNLFFVTLDLQFVLSFLMLESLWGREREREMCDSFRICFSFYFVELFLSESLFLFLPLFLVMFTSFDRHLWLYFNVSYL